LKRERNLDRQYKNLRKLQGWIYVAKSWIHVKKSFPSHIKNRKQPIGAIVKPPKLEFPSLLFSFPPLKNTAKPISSYSQNEKNKKASLKEKN
jgi:hypothetical protein